MNNKSVLFKIVIYTMLIIMLASTLLFSLNLFLS